MAVNFSKNDKRISMNKTLGLLFLIFASLLIVGCSDKGTAEDTAEGNGTEAEETGVQSEQAIRAVIEKEFTGPDEKYIELWDAVVETDTSDSDMSQEEYVATLERPEYQELMSYMEETYAPYFTENGYDNFIRAFAFMYTRHDQEYELNTSNIEITQSENGETLYNFTFQVNYTDQYGESSQFDFAGRAIVSEEGKIGKIEFFDGYEDGLFQELINNK